MKLKELITVLEDTDFETTANVRKGWCGDVNKQVLNLKLSDFGCDSYRHQRWDTLVIKFKDEKLEFSSCYCLKSNEELMNREVVKVEKLQLDPFMNLSEKGDKYRDTYSCQLIIVVE